MFDVCWSACIFKLSHLLTIAFCFNFKCYNKGWIYSNNTDKKSKWQNTKYKKKMKMQNEWHTNFFQPFLSFAVGANDLYRKPIWIMLSSHSLFDFLRLSVVSTIFFHCFFFFWVATSLLNVRHFRRKKRI